ncbi:MAG TPA: YqaA family protein [Thermoguttaceae bacterium]|nr:YqaA family protein [Thermoguttaceae bacterium]HPP51472.1 YqaA family protein [Thermoguttaceae bacterium]
MHRHDVSEQVQSAQSPPEADSDRPRKRPGPMKRLYRWVLHWAETPYGTPALFGLAFAESSFFPIPPDVLQIALSVSKPRRSFYYALVSGVGSVLGGIAGWVIGFAFWSAVSGFFYNYVPGCTPENFQRVQTLYEQNAFWAILGAAFTPIPYKVFTIAAGVFSIALPVLITASFLGRFGRFFLVASAIYFLGPGIQRLLDRYFEWVTLALFVLLVGGFLAIKYLL